MAICQSLLRNAVLGLGLLVVLPSWALEPTDFQDPALQARYKELITELRCLVCQNQSIAESNAELAQDLRRETRAMLRQGATDAEIVEFMVARYGDYVLYRPPLKGSTVFLWVGPFLLLFGAAGVLIASIARRARPSADTPLDADEQARLDRLLADRETSS